MTIKWKPASEEELARRVSAPEPKPAAPKPTKKAAAKSEDE